GIRVFHVTGVQTCALPISRMAPSVGVADVRDGEALVFSDTQKPHNTRDGIAKLLDLPPERVRVVWRPGPGSYGRSDADEAAFEEIGRAAGGDRAANKQCVR